MRVLHAKGAMARSWAARALLGGLLLWSGAGCGVAMSEHRDVAHKLDEARIALARAERDHALREQGLIERVRELEKSAPSLAGLGGLAGSPRPVPPASPCAADHGAAETSAALSQSLREVLEPHGWQIGEREGHLSLVLPAVGLGSDGRAQVAGLQAFAGPVPGETKTLWALRLRADAPGEMGHLRRAALVAVAQQFQAAGLEVVVWLTPGELQSGTSSGTPPASGVTLELVPATHVPDAARASRQPLGS